MLFLYLNYARFHRHELLQSVLFSMRGISSVLEISLVFSACVRGMRQQEAMISDEVHTIRTFPGKKFWGNPHLGFSMQIWHSVMEFHIWYSTLNRLANLRHGKPWDSYQKTNNIPNLEIWSLRYNHTESSIALGLCKKTSCIASRGYMMMSGVCTVRQCPELWDSRWNCESSQVCHSHAINV